MQKIRWPMFVAAVLLVALFPLGFPFAYAQSQNRMLYGKVYSTSTGQPLAAIVTVTKCGYTQSVMTTSDGSWQLSYPYGWSGSISFSSPGYVTETFQIGLNGQWYDAGGVLSLQPA